MSFNIVLIIVGHHIIENLNRVLGVLVVYDRLLDVETWNLAGDTVFLDEPLFVGGGVLQVSIDDLIVILKRIINFPSYLSLDHHLFSALLDVLALMVILPVSLDMVWVCTRC